jgi:hypothetical protein
MKVYSGFAIPAFRRHVTIYTPSFMMTGIGTEKLLGRYKYRQQGDLINLKISKVG